jgi:hypothetical protein
MMATAARRNGTDEKRDEWLSIPQAQRMLGIARHTLLARTLDGEFESTVVAGRRVISRASVDKAIAAQGA